MEQKYIKGDIVMYDNKIHTIMDTLGVNNYELSYISHPVNQLELSEVPLTADILEKNRWKKDDRGYNFRDIIFLNKDSFGGWVVGIGEDYILTIASIHQLQHLLFCLGLNSEMEVSV